MAHLTYSNPTLICMDFPWISTCFFSRKSKNRWPQPTVTSEAQQMAGDLQSQEISFLMARGDGLGFRLLQIFVQKWYVLWLLLGEQILTNAIKSHELNAFSSFGRSLGGSGSFGGRLGEASGKFYWASDHNIRLLDALAAMPQHGAIFHQPVALGARF